MSTSLQGYWFTYYTRVCHHTLLTHPVLEPCSRLNMEQHPLVMWSAVCSAPQSQLSLVDSPQRSIFAPNLPTPVRGLFSRVQARLDRYWFTEREGGRRQAGRQAGRERELF